MEREPGCPNWAPRWKPESGPGSTERISQAPSLEVWNMLEMEHDVMGGGNNIRGCDSNELDHGN